LKKVKGEWEEGGRGEEEKRRKEEAEARKREVKIVMERQHIALDTK
jgi:hypothetical protein